MKKIIRLTEYDLTRIVKKVLREQTEEVDYWDEAVSFCTGVDLWWKGEKLDKYDSDMDRFFEPFQDFWDDADNKAAETYENMIMVKFNKEISSSNPYRKEINQWLNCIIDQIDDLFQNECELLLKNKETGESEYFRIDPEIG